MAERPSQHPLDGTGPADDRPRIRLERDSAGQAAHVVIDRPDKHNAFDRQMWLDLDDAFAGLAEDPALRCVTLRGAGGRAFSTGADIGEFETVRRTSEEAMAYGRIVHAAWKRLAACPVPTIAVIDGLCVGGGLETACHADLRTASTASRFGIPIKRLGLVLAYEELKPVVDLIGPSRAGELLYLGRIIDAETAAAWGLVNTIVPPDELGAHVAEAVEAVVSGAPLVARWHKRFIQNLATGEPLDAEERAAGYACYDTEDFRIGYNAFLERAEPEFVGR